MGVQDSPGEKHEGRAAAVSGAISGAQCACMQQAAILKQQQKQQRQKLPEAPR